MEGPSLNSSNAAAKNLLNMMNKAKQGMADASEQIKNVFIKEEGKLRETFSSLMDALSKGRRVEELESKKSAESVEVAQVGSEDDLTEDAGTVDISSDSESATAESNESRISEEGDLGEQAEIRAQKLKTKTHGHIDFLYGLIMLSLAITSIFHHLVDTPKKHMVESRAVKAGPLHLLDFSAGAGRPESTNSSDTGALEDDQGYDTVDGDATDYEGIGNGGEEPSPTGDDQDIGGFFPSNDSVNVRRLAQTPSPGADDGNPVEGSFARLRLNENQLKTIQTELKRDNELKGFKPGDDSYYKLQNFGKLDYVHPQSAFVHGDALGAAVAGNAPISAGGMGGSETQKRSGGATTPAFEYPASPVARPLSKKIPKWLQHELDDLPPAFSSKAGARVAQQSRSLLNAPKKVSKLARSNAVDEDEEDGEYSRYQLQPKRLDFNADEELTQQGDLESRALLNKHENIEDDLADLPPAFSPEHRAGVSQQSPSLLNAPKKRVSKLSRSKAVVGDGAEDGEYPRYQLQPKRLAFDADKALPQQGDLESRTPSARPVSSLSTNAERAQEQSASAFSPANRPRLSNMNANLMNAPRKKMVGNFVGGRLVVEDKGNEENRSPLLQPQKLNFGKAELLRGPLAAGTDTSEASSSDSAARMRPVNRGGVVRRIRAVFGDKPFYTKRKIHELEEGRPLNAAFSTETAEDTSPSDSEYDPEYYRNYQVRVGNNDVDADEFLLKELGEDYQLMSGDWRYKNQETGANNSEYPFGDAASTGDKSTQADGEAEIYESSVLSGAENFGEKKHIESDFE